MRLLLVEDDPLPGDGIKEGLIDAGFVVDWLTDDESTRLALITYQPASAQPFGFAPPLPAYYRLA